MDYEKPLTDKQCELFAFMLKQKRKDNKITLKQLGDKLGYSTAIISNWENLKAVPDFYNVEDVATYFKIIFCCSLMIPPSSRPRCIYSALQLSISSCSS